MRRFLEHDARGSRGATDGLGWLAALLCAIFCVAPGAAADGRWLPNETPAAADFLRSEAGNGDAAFDGPSAPAESRVVVIAHGLVPRGLSESRTARDSASGPTPAPLLLAPSTARAFAAEGEPARPSGSFGGDLHVRHCVFLI